LNQDKLRITVAVPACNAEKYLRRNISGIKDLDPKPSRIIVIDDGSKDRTPKILAGFPDVVVITHEKNMGLASARNSALAQCDTDIIVYFDSDTLPDKDFIKKIAACYRDENIAGVGGRAIEAEAETLWDRWRSSRMKQEHSAGGDAMFLWGVCSSYRVEILRSLGGFDTDFRTNGEDIEIGTRLKNKGYRLIYEPSAAVLHLKHDSLSSLTKAIYRWYYWGIIALRKNRKRFFINYLKIIIKNPLRYFLQKKWDECGFSFVLIDVLAFAVEMTALVSASLKKLNKVNK